MQTLQDKVAIITGGGTGIGKAACLDFARNGAHVVVIGNVEADAKQTAGEVRALGREGVAMVADVTDAGEMRNIAAKVIEKFGRIDILVTSAGVMGDRTFLVNTTDEGWCKTMDVNLNGTFYCVKAVLPQMMEQKSGRIITISSISGKLPAAMNADYSASKHAVIGMTKALAIELGLLGLNGITANSVCPGSVDTPMISEITEHMRGLTGEDPEMFIQERIASKNLQQRLLEPEEIAGMITYLASDIARGITGQAINVCAGTVLF
ncbi:3-Oxoacyl (acyl-carrier protein) reductase [Desulfatibacillum aliphaticivorans]|uniref:3-Oxoacyl (Acyl-carrier protein) reductase n=1 Tax=Desulfatibacillum aliphaticivorans TaxID=218208 RepID=B8FMX5_DESAL|nr:SDR family NAD(P)-dependent oxidoreductase [Desulfatibacillum aliphaticivorans]ACL05845.1 3-Oxoacyl (acyl-carrier protein) reductase [Desulfatibacillum aliphaticivorans]